MKTKGLLLSCLLNSINTSLAKLPIRVESSKLHAEVNTVSMNYTLRLILMVMIVFFLVETGKCQDSKPKSMINVIPPLPEAASLGKFGDIPVGLFTGVPQISIPLYSIELRDFTLPVSLDYHAAGVRVEEISSNVGIGWALNAGGMISCTVNGIYDFEPNYGYASGGIGGSAKDLYDKYQDGSLLTAQEYSSNVTDPSYTILYELAKGGQDGDPDIFNFNFAGRSGRFILDENLIPRTMPYEPIKIEPDFETASKFVITDEKGNRYFFEEAELAYLERAPGADCDIVNWFYGTISYTPTWYLSRIETKSGDFLQFRYDNISYSYTVKGNETRYERMPSSSASCYLPDTKCGNIINVSIGKRLEAIESNKGHLVLFKYSTDDRFDLPGTKALSEIVVKSSSNTEALKTWKLEQEYFTASTHDTNPVNFRLKLTSLKENNNPAYHFEYTGNLPSRDSNSQDYWGFHNGASNSHLVPEIIASDGKVYGGANREVDTVAMQNGILNKIKYPTGGTTEFFYEAHEFHFQGTERTIKSLVSPELTLQGMGEVTTTFTTGPSPGTGGGLFSGRVSFQTNVIYLPPGDVVTGWLGATYRTGILRTLPSIER